MRAVHFAPLINLALLAGACAPAKTPTPFVVPLDTPRPTATDTPTPEPTATPAPTETPLPPRELTICTGAEPSTLYLYEGTEYLGDLIRQAIYDGPIDTRGFDYQPVILEKLPSLADGDAKIEPVQVQPGDQVVDARGEVASLTEGVVVRPAGCRGEACAVTFDGGPLTMDQLSATFKILEGIKWSDGTPLTAVDTVFSYEIARDCRTPFGPCTSGLANFGGTSPVTRTASYAALDDLTVRWVGLPGFLDPNYRTNFFFPLPHHQLGHLSADELLDAEEINYKPLGWGPYKVIAWTPSFRMVLERNPYYFRASEGLPYFDRLTFRFMYQEGSAPNLDALQRGSCDVLALDTHLDDGLQRLLELQSTGKLKLYANPDMIWEHLDYGINPAPGYDRPDYFEDVRMRRAIAHCIDRERLVDQVWYGLSLLPHAYIFPSHPLYPDSGLRAYEYSPEAGRALLEEIGWRDADGDGVREAHGVAGIAEGTALRLNHETTDAESRRRMAGQIAEDLSACGIALTVNHTPAAEFFVESADGRVFGRRFDLIHFAWLTGVVPPCKLFLSSEIPSEANAWKGTNVTGYSSPAFDAACQAALAALPGEPEYTAWHQEALRIFVEELPVLPLTTRLSVSASRPDLIGLQVDFTQWTETWNIEEWRLEGE